MRALGVGLIVIAALCLIAMLGCWGAAVWLEDVRWGSTAGIFFVAMTITGFAGGMVTSFAGDNP